MWRLIGARGYFRTRPPIKVLVVEDDAGLLGVFSSELMHNGFNVFPVTNMRDAASRFVKQRPEIVILDYEMSGDQAVETASEILSMSPSTRIIMLTPKDAVLEEEAERIGIEIFLVKPVSPKILVGSVVALSHTKLPNIIVNK